MKPIGGMGTVRAGMIMAGWRTLSGWAVSRGYHPKTVWRAVMVWGNRADQRRGGITREIMRDLRRSLGEEYAV